MTSAKAAGKFYSNRSAASRDPHVSSSQKGQSSAAQSSQDSLVSPIMVCICRDYNGIGSHGKELGKAHLVARMY